MSSIPLPALGLKPPQQPDLMGDMAKVMQLKSMQQGQQEGALDLQQKQRQMQDQQTIMQVAAAHGGNIMAALPELAGKISAASFIPLQKSIIDTQKTYSDMKKTDLENEKASADQLLGLVTQAKQMDPATYQQNWPQIAARALEIEPGLGNKVNPQQPIPQQELEWQALRFATHSQLATIETQKREAADETRKTDMAAETLRHNQAMEDEPTEARLALRSAQGDTDAEAALKRLDQSKRASRPVINNMTANDAKDIADAIENGDQPPTLQGLYRNAGPVRAELARRGVPLAQMETDWKGTQKYMATLNGAQQVRLRQAISTAADSLDKIDSLYQEYHSIVGDAGMKVFNKAGLVAAKNLPGRAGAVATALDAQIADVTSELGNVYMGGNSPTDHSLGLAGKNLSSDWNRETFEEALKQAHANLKIRQNSITHAAPAGLSGNTDYFKPNQQPDNAAPKGATKTYQGHTYAQQPDGSWKLAQ